MQLSQILSSPEVTMTTPATTDNTNTPDVAKAPCGWSQLPWYLKSRILHMATETDIDPSANFNDDDLPAYKVELRSQLRDMSQLARIDSDAGQCMEDVFEGKQRDIKKAVNRTKNLQKGLIDQGYAILNLPRHEQKLAFVGWNHRYREELLAVAPMSRMVKKQLKRQQRRLALLEMYVKSQNIRKSPIV